MTGNPSMHVEVEVLCRAAACKVFIEGGHEDPSQGEVMRLTTDVDDCGLGLYRCPHCGTEVTVRMTVKN